MTRLLAHPPLGLHKRIVKLSLDIGRTHYRASKQGVAAARQLQAWGVQALGGSLKLVEDWISAPPPPVTLTRIQTSAVASDETRCLADGGGKTDDSQEVDQRAAKEDTLDDGAEKTALLLPYVAAHEIYTLHASNVTLQGKAPTARVGEYVLAGPSRFHAELQAAPALDPAGDPTRGAVHVRCPTVVLADSRSKNYYHFMAEVLSRYATCCATRAAVPCVHVFCLLAQGGSRPAAHCACCHCSAEAAKPAGGRRSAVPGPAVPPVLSKEERRFLSVRGAQERVCVCVRICACVMCVAVCSHAINYPTHTHTRT